MIKYQYALDDNGKLVNVNSLSRKEVPSGTYFDCLSCGKKLVPRLGEKRQKHFAHKVEVNCSGETYLHKLGKEKFVLAFRKAKEEGTTFWVEIPRIILCNEFSSLRKTCREHEDTFEKIDLASRYETVEVEMRDGSFIPDVLLKNEAGDKLYFEIAASHTVTSDKIKSGVPIIELRVKEEAELTVIDSQNLERGWADLAIYNFKQFEVERKRCKGYGCEVHRKWEPLLSISLLQNFLSERMATNQPFRVTIPREITCNRFKNKLEKECSFLSYRSFNLLKYYKVLERPSKSLPYLVLKREATEEDPIIIWVRSEKVPYEKELEILKDHRQIRFYSLDTIQEITNKGKIEPSDKVHFSNFYKDSGKESWSCKDSQPCRCDYQIFALYPSGKGYVGKVDLKKAAETKEKSNFFFIFPDYRDYYFGVDQWREGYIRAYLRGHKVKNCGLCRYHGKNRKYHSRFPYFCKYLRKEVAHSDAISCSAYRLDEEVFREDLETIRQDIELNS